MVTKTVTTGFGTMRADLTTGRTPMDYLYDALLTIAPQVLTDLRDTPATTEAVTAWARRYRLDSPAIVEYMTTLRVLWDKSPKAAQALRQLIVTFTVPYKPKGSEAAQIAWLRENVHVIEMPDPSQETLKEWLARARYIYGELLKLNQDYRPKAHTRRTDRASHYQWFVQVYIFDKKPSGNPEPTGVNREVNRVVAELGLPRRRRPGRPKKT